MTGHNPERAEQLAGFMRSREGYDSEAVRAADMLDAYADSLREPAAVPPNDDAARAEAERLLSDYLRQGENYPEPNHHAHAIIATFAEGLRAPAREAWFAHAVASWKTEEEMWYDERDALREALQRIVAWYGDRDAGWHGDEPRAIARAALGGEGPDG